VIAAFARPAADWTCILVDGQAVNLSAAANIGELGMACPKGWEALTPLSAPDRATTPLLRIARRGALSRSIGISLAGLHIEI